MGRCGKRYAQAGHGGTTPGRATSPPGVAARNLGRVPPARPVGPDHGLCRPRPFPMVNPRRTAQPVASPAGPGRKRNLLRYAIDTATSFCHLGTREWSFYAGPAPTGSDAPARPLANMGHAPCPDQMSGLRPNRSIVVFPHRRRAADQADSLRPDRARARRVRGYQDDSSILTMENHENETLATSTLK